MKAAIAQCMLASVLMLCNAFPHPGDTAETSLVRLSLRKARMHDKIRRRSVPASLYNTYYEYLVDLKVGTPAQNITVSLDTGSSDTWVVGPGSCDTCSGGFFDPTKSSTILDKNDLGPFSISYFDNSAVSGHYISDKVSIGSATVKGVILAVADSVDPGDSGDYTYGIMGVGLPGLEASTTQYPGFVDALFKQGLIASRSYSIYLDDIEDDTGTITFGGVDSTKYSGKLVPLPIVPYTDDYPRLQVEWTKLSLTDSAGHTTVLSASNLSYPSTLDTGYTTIVVPTDMFNSLATFFGVIVLSDGTCTVPCKMPDGHLTFGFGKGPAVTIKVPFYELAIPMDDDRCLFGLSVQDDDVMSFGDPFLRTAYTVYNFDKMTISLAQAVWVDN